MRALIVVLAAAVIALAAWILARPTTPRRVAPVFEASRLIADARRGERATYRDESGTTVTYLVEGAVPGGDAREPLVRVLVVYRDRLGAVLPGGTARYDHRPARHGLFPLMAPGDPEGHDRLWVWQRLRRLNLAWRGRERPAWRFDLVDPALPTEGGGDHVVAWIDEQVPVFGLVRWERAGHAWELVASEPTP